MTGFEVVFLDRDGTLIEERDYLADPDDVVLFDGAPAALRRLRKRGLRLVIVTNQSGIGRGYITESQVAAVNARLVDLLAAEGVTLDGIYVCPHAPDDGCRCRKPATGMTEQAAAALGVDPAAGFMIGDKTIDMTLGRNIGATTILVLTGYGAAQREEAAPFTDHVADNMTGAARIIETLLANDAE